MSQSGHKLFEKVYLLSQIIQDVAEVGDVKKVAPFLTRAQFQILKILSTAGGKTASELADLFNVSRPAISKTVDKLLKNLLVNRVDSELDRRSALLSLTKLGEQLITDYNRHRSHRMDRIQREFTEEEIVVFDNLVGRYINTCVAIDKNIDLICVQCDGRFHHECSFKEMSESCYFKIRAVDQKK